jgi:hypothetical protein
LEAQALTPNIFLLEQKVLLVLILHCLQVTILLKFGAAVAGVQMAVAMVQAVAEAVDVLFIHLLLPLLTLNFGLDLLVRRLLEQTVPVTEERLLYMVIS